jgi:hypothetical protein
MNNVEEIELGSLGELVDTVTPAEQDPSSGRLRDASIYRGSANPEWPLLTSLDRLGGTDPPHTKAELEEHILRNFLRYSRPYLPQPYASEWELLVVAQHHGLPTRLLDWSYSPLIAAHFATLKPDPGADRVIWRLEWKRVHEHFGIQPLALLVQDLDAVLREKGVGSLWDLFRDDRDGGSGVETFACMLEPPALDDRIVAQSAAFTFCSIKNRPFDQVLDELGLASALTRYVIPAGRVDRFRDQLDLCSVDERRLFPDLDGVAAQMRRYYDASARDTTDPEACD